MFYSMQCCTSRVQLQGGQYSHAVLSVKQKRLQLLTSSLPRRLNFFSSSRVQQAMRVDFSNQSIVIVDSWYMQQGAVREEKSVKHCVLLMRCCRNHGAHQRRGIHRREQCSRVIFCRQRVVVVIASSFRNDSRWYGKRCYVNLTKVCRRRFRLMFKISDILLHFWTCRDRQMRHGIEATFCTFYPPPRFVKKLGEG